MAELDLSKKVADRYLKREVLGEGTYGVVYKAIDTQVTFSNVNLIKEKYEKKRTVMNKIMGIF